MARVLVAGLINIETTLIVFDVKTIDGDRQRVFSQENRTIQELLRQSDVKRTMVHAYLLNRAPGGRAMKQNRRISPSSRNIHIQEPNEVKPRGLGSCPLR